MTNILDNSYESDITEEEHERLILMSEHAIAKPISPATQAVLDAFRSSHTGQGCLAAALRAAADQVVPREKMSKDPLWQSQTAKQRQDTRAYLLAIAAELES